MRYKTALISQNSKKITNTKTSIFYNQIKCTQKPINQKTK